MSKYIIRFKGFSLIIYQNKTKILFKTGPIKINLIEIENKRIFELVQRLAQKIKN